MENVAANGYVRLSPQCFPRCRSNARHPSVLQLTLDSMGADSCMPSSCDTNCCGYHNMQPTLFKNILTLSLSMLGLVCR